MIALAIAIGVAAHVVAALCTWALIRVARALPRPSVTVVIPEIQAERYRQGAAA